MEDPDALADPVAVLRSVELPQRVAEPETLAVPIPVELSECLGLPLPLEDPAGVPVSDPVDDPETLADPLAEEATEELAAPLGLADPDELEDGLAAPLPLTDPETVPLVRPLGVTTDPVASGLAETVGLVLGVITEGVASAVPDTVVEPVLLVDREREPLPVPLPVREPDTVPVEHTELVPDLEPDTDPVPLTVPLEVFDAVVVDDSLTVDVVETDAESDADALLVLVDRSVALTVSHPLVLGLRLPEPETEGLPLSLKVLVAAPELVTLGLLEERPERLRVTLTVWVTPVGNVLGETVGLPPPLVVIVKVSLGLTELLMLTDPDTVDVLDMVVEAVTVAVSFRDAVAPIENVVVGVPDWVLEGGEDRVKVTEVVGVLDWLEEPVIVPDPVALLLVWEDAEYVAEPVEQADSVTLPAEVGVGGAARVELGLTVWVIVALLPVSDTVVVPVDVFELVTDPVAVGDPVSVTESLGVRLGLRERRGVREASSVPLWVGEADRVLVATTVRVPVAEKVLVFDPVVLAVSVLDPPVLRECVADPVGDFVVVIVRVPLVVAVPVLLAVLVAVEVTLRRIL